VPRGSPGFHEVQFREVQFREVQFREVQFFEVPRSSAEFGL
jgi:hypothetical protein